jgi:hypothetical protein
MLSSQSPRALLCSSLLSKPDGRGSHRGVLTSDQDQDGSGFSRITRALGVPKGSLVDEDTRSPRCSRGRWQWLRGARWRDPGKIRLLQILPRSKEDAGSAQPAARAQQIAAVWESGSQTHCHGLVSEGLTPLVSHHHHQSSPGFQNAVSMGWSRTSWHYTGIVQWPQSHNRMWGRVVMQESRGWGSCVQWSLLSF